MLIVYVTFPFQNKSKETFTLLAFKSDYTVNTSMTTHSDCMWTSISWAVVLFHYSVLVCSAQFFLKRFTK